MVFLKSTLCCFAACCFLALVAAEPYPEPYLQLPIPENYRPLVQPFPEPHQQLPRSDKVRPLVQPFPDRHGFIAKERRLTQPLLVRKARSPQHGSVDLTYKQDQGGREAGVQYNHNLYSNGRGSIDAYAQASRNFDRNQNSYGGGIRGSWRF